MTARVSPRYAIERRLHALGFVSPDIRRLLATQIMVTALALAVGFMFAWLSIWPLIFGVGAAIALFSLWQLARFAQANIRRQFSAALGLQLFFGLTGRLALIGVLLFFLIVLFRAPVIPLLAGLTSTIAAIVCWGLARLSRKTVKEA